MEEFFKTHWSIVAILFGALWTIFLTILTSRFRELVEKQNKLDERIRTLEIVASSIERESSAIEHLVEAVNDMKLTFSNRLSVIETKLAEND